MTETKSSTLLSDRLRNTGKILRESAERQIRDHNSRFEMINNFYDELFRDLLVQEFDTKRALNTAKTMLGSNEFNFVAVDGTEYSKPIFDMVAFFGGSYASEGRVCLSEGGVKVSYKEDEYVKQGIGISSCAPVYVDKIPEIDQVFMDISQPGELNLRKQFTEDTVVDNSTISNWIMTFSEFYLAYKLAMDQQRNVKLILLDRNLSGMLSSIIYDTSKRKLWKTSCAIHGLEVEGRPIDENDLAYGRQRLMNQALEVPPPRGDYLRYYLIQLVEQKGPLSEEEILRSLGLSAGDENDVKKIERARRYLNRSVTEGYLEVNNAKYSVTSKYANIWPLLRSLTERLGRQLFDDPEVANPLLITKGGKEEWLSTLDLGFLTLFCLYMLVEECWKRKILLIGMTKDTTAKDFKNHLLPVCIENDIVQGGRKDLQLDAVPSTDRMMLQSVSLFNASKVKVPWSLVEYDSAFIMIVPDFQKRKGTSGPGFSIVCDSFFIHGRNSWVEFNHNSETVTRELGDIIFMISVVRDWKVYLQRLTINQVKKTSVNGHSWNIDPEQLFLLSSLPTFSGAPGSWYYGSEISVPNLSGCLGSFGLIYNSDFIFESAIDLSDSLGDRQRISLHEVRTSISYLSALNNATINVARLPPLGFQFSNFRAASDATDFSTKFLRLSIGEWSFISPGWTDNPQARIVPKLIASVVEMLHKHGSDEFGMILKYLTIPYNGISYPNNNGPPPQESTPGEPGTAVFHVVVILE